MTTRFQLRDEYIELIKLLKATGLCESGGEAKSVVEEGLVLVDGEVETRKKKKIRSGQRVAYEGNQIDVE